MFVRHIHRFASHGSVHRLTPAVSLLLWFGSQVRRSHASCDVGVETSTCPVQPKVNDIKIPCFTYEEIQHSNHLRTEELFERLAQAYGPDGPGILCVKGPDIHRKIVHIRQQFLPMAVHLTNLPESSKARLIDPDSPLTNGLSRGSEVTDRAKSSFYYHPETDTPGDYLPSDVSHVPLFHNPNLFPDETEMPVFKKEARDAAQFVVSVGANVAELVDRYLLAKLEGYEARTFATHVREGPTSNHKCRLIHYHPYETVEELNATNGMWAAAHLDTGSLTGLVPGVFLDHHGRPTENPDPDSGLYIVNRNGQPFKATLPPDAGEALLFQVGEALQIVSGGMLQATPHFVQGPKLVGGSHGASRVSLAVFMQPQPHEHLLLPRGMSPFDIAAKSADRHLPASWPTLDFRFKFLGLKAGDSLTFGQHGYATFSNLKAADQD